MYRIVIFGYLMYSFAILGCGVHFGIMFHVFWADFVCKAAIRVVFLVVAALSGSCLVCLIVCWVLWIIVKWKIHKELDKYP